MTAIFIDGPRSRVLPIVRARSAIKTDPYRPRPECAAPGCRQTARRACGTCWDHASEYEMKLPHCPLCGWALRDADMTAGGP